MNWSAEMRAVLPAGQLVDALRLVADVVNQGAVDRSSRLGNVKIKAALGRLELRATDLDIEIGAIIQAKVIEPGELAVNCKKLTALIYACRDDAMISLADAVKSLEIKTGAGCYRLAKYAAADLSTLPAVVTDSKVILDGADFLRLLEPVDFASDSAARAYLGGIYIHNKDGDLAAAATNGVILARVAVAGAVKGTPQSDDSGPIIPSRTALLLRKVVARSRARSVTLRWSKSLLAVESPAFAIVNKLLQGQYPDYQRVLPRPADDAVICKKRELIDCLNRLSAVASTELPAVALSWSGERQGLIVYLARQPDDAIDVIEAEISGTARVAARLDQLTSCADALQGERLRIEANSIGPLRLVCPDDTAKVLVLMPTRFDLNRPLKM